ncbi:unnamed protein product [Cunninghamella blakesleeana]
MDKVERKKLNLKAIKRYDSAIVNILDQSPHSVLYNFSQEKREWVKKSIEGVLFLVQRNAPPYFAVYIMNRLAMENYTLYLTDFEDMELQQNFIMYSTKGGERYAFWLYEEKDRIRLLNKITRLHDGIQKELSAKTQSTQNSTQSNTQSTSQLTSQSNTQTDQQTSGSGTAAVDLLSMLKNATPRHYPPNEYGPEQIEQKHQQQHPFHHPSPAMLPPFQEPIMNQWIPPPPPPSSVPELHTPEFTLPNAELMMPQSHHHHPPSSEQPNGNRLLELLQKSVINNDSQQQPQHIPSPGPPPHQAQPAPPPEWNNGNRLLELLKKATIDDQKNMQHTPSPPPPMHPAVNMLFGTPPQQHPHLPHPPPPLSSSSSTPNTMAAPPPPHPLFGKELTKPYTPMAMGENNNNNFNSNNSMSDNNNNNSKNNTSRNTNQSQGRNSALLLQALQGGMLNAPSSTTVNNNSNGSINSDDGNNNNSLSVNGINGQHEFSTTSSVVTLHGSPGPDLPSSSRSSFSNVTPLMPQQTLSLAQQEINKRLGVNQQQQQQRFLSKPEFIQQFLNIVQNDPTFFDTLYEDYKTQKTNGMANN